MIRKDKEKGWFENMDKSDVIILTLLITITAIAGIYHLFMWNLDPAIINLSACLVGSILFLDTGCMAQGNEEKREWTEFEKTLIIWIVILLLIDCILFAYTQRYWFIFLMALVCMVSFYIAQRSHEKNGPKEISKEDAQIIRSMLFMFLGLLSTFFVYGLSAHDYNLAIICLVVHTFCLSMYLELDKDKEVERKLIRMVLATLTLQLATGTIFCFYYEIYDSASLQLILCVIYLYFYLRFFFDHHKARNER